VDNIAKMVDNNWPHCSPENPLEEVLQLSRICFLTNCPNTVENKFCTLCAK
jgi:hypothetical protein